MLKTLFAAALTAVVTSALFAAPLAAQEVLGRSVIEGKQVEILSDKTWRFTDEARGDTCTDLQLGLRFCNDDQTWLRTDFESPDVAAQYRVDDRHYGQFVLEALGTKDGFSSEFMRRAVIENAAGAAGVDVSEIAVLDVSPVTVQSHTGETVKYLTNLDGLNIMFFNTILVLDERTFQIITFSVNREITDNHLRLHDDFLNRVRID